MSDGKKKDLPDHKAIPLSVREGSVDLNEENYRLQILRHNKRTVKKRTLT